MHERARSCQAHSGVMVSSSGGNWHGMIFANVDSSHIIRKQMQGREEYSLSDMKRAGIWWKAGMEGKRKMVLEQAV